MSEKKQPETLKKWYILRAISGKEAKVKEYIESEMRKSDLGNYVSQVLIPTEKVVQVRNGKKVTTERNYLPGYVLVEIADAWHVAPDKERIKQEEELKRVKQEGKAQAKGEEQGEEKPAEEGKKKVKKGEELKKELPGKIVYHFPNEVGQRLRDVPNVLGFLSEKPEKGGIATPTPLRPGEVSRILGQVDEAAEDENLGLQFAVGETVKVNYGPFTGFSGDIEEVNNERKKLKVMVKIFGRKTPLELGFMQVEKE